jgi:hypothetical protein
MDLRLESSVFGTPEAVYRISFWKPLGVAALSLGFPVLGILFVSVPFSCSSLIWIAVTSVFPIVGFVLIFGGILHCLDLLSKAGASVFVYREGMVVKRVWSQDCLWSEDFYPWKDIVQVWSKENHAHLGGTNSSFLDYLVSFRDGRSLLLAYMPGLSELGRRIEEEACRHMLPEALKRFDEGFNIDFARIVVNQQGVMVNPNNLRIFFPRAAIRRGVPRGAYVVPWADITDIFFEAPGPMTGCLSIGGPKGKIRTRPGLAVSPNKVSDVLLLIRLLQAIKPEIHYSGGTVGVLTR